MEIRKYSERPAEGRNKDHHLQNTVRVRANAGPSKSWVGSPLPLPTSFPEDCPHKEGLPRGPKGSLQALPHPDRRLVPHTSRRNGLRLLRLVEGDQKGGRGRALVVASGCGHTCTSRA